MPLLEIRHRTGRIETRELSREVPLLVGQLPSSDIQVDAEGVAPIHCRISWQRKNFEVTSVAPEGVQFNGTTVRHHLLAPGDVLRVGDVDIVLLADAREPAVASAGSPAATAPEDDVDGGKPEKLLASQYELQPLSEGSLPVRAFHVSSLFGREAAEKHPQVTKGEGPDNTPAAASPGKADRKPSEGPRRAGMSRVAESILELDDLARDESEAPAIDPPRPPPSLGSAARRLRQSLAVPRVRPQERDPLRSPLVLGLGGGVLILLLSAGSLWFVLSREKAQQAYDRGKAELLNGQYPQAVESLESFLRDYPRHALAPQARIDIGTARVEQALGGGSPAWDKGLEALDEFIKQHLDTKALADPDSALRKFVLSSADRLAFGAIDAARVQHRRPLLGVSAEAVKLIELYSPADNRPEARLKELAEAAVVAEAAIRQREAFDAAVKTMDEALAEKRPREALQAYRRVLDRYRPPESAAYAAAIGYRPLADRLKKARDIEREATARDEQSREPAPALPPAEATPVRLTLMRRSRARTDVPSVDAAVFVLAQDALFGIDSVTAEPLWGRTVGRDLPFAPMAVSAGQPAWLYYDVRRRELVLIAQRTGALFWRLPLGARPRGAPRIYEGQAYLATDDNALEQIDLQTGRSTARLKFSQTIGGTCAVSLSGERLYVTGHENVLYVLTRRPLACEQVVWLGHGPGSVTAPAVMMRTLLLLAENDRQDSCLLRIFETAREDQKPDQVASYRIDGHVSEAPALRGKELFVPSTPERVTAFVVAESADEHTLTRVGEYQVKDAGPAPILLVTGPDGRMWMQSTALRRFDATRNSLLPSKQQLGPGLASQPLQSSGDSLFLGRRLPYSHAVVFAEADRQQMAVQWQLALGAGILESTLPSAQDGAVLCVTSLGDLFQVTPQKLLRGGFDLQPVGQLPVPEGLSETLSAVRLSDGRLAVFCGGDEPRLWLPLSDGTPHEQKLAEALQAAPVPLAGGLLLALPGRLRVSGRPAGEPPVEDLPAPIGRDQPPRWIGLFALDDRNALAVSEQGRATRVQFGTAPVPHLEEISHWDTGSPVDLPPAMAEGRLFIVDATSRLVMLDAGLLEPTAQVVLEASAAARPRPAGELVLVELKTGRLVAYDVPGKLAKRWDVPLDGAALAGDPLVADGSLLIALTDGRVMWLDPVTGQASRTLDLGQQLGFGPRKWREAIVVGTLDGTLLVVSGAAPGGGGN
jgi:tetratricopeptide (TPR) repeat protein